MAQKPSSFVYFLAGLHFFISKMSFFISTYEIPETALKICQWKIRPQNKIASKMPPRNIFFTDVRKNVGTLWCAWSVPKSLPRMAPRKINYIPILAFLLAKNWLKLILRKSILRQKFWFIIAPPSYLEIILLNAIFITSHTFSQTSKN